MSPMRGAPHGRKRAIQLVPTPRPSLLPGHGTRRLQWTRQRSSSAAGQRTHKWFFEQAQQTRPQWIWGCTTRRIHARQRIVVQLVGYIVISISVAEPKAYMDGSVGPALPSDGTNWDARNPCLSDIRRYSVVSPAGNSMAAGKSWRSSCGYPRFPTSTGPSYRTCRNTSKPTIQIGQENGHRTPEGQNARFVGRWKRR